MDIKIDNTNLPRKEEITIIKQGIQRDLTEFLQGISINVPKKNTEAFFGKLEELITYKGTAVDFDRFREDFNTLIATYSIDKKHNAVVPVESSSTDNVIIHDEQGSPKSLVVSDNKEETDINIQNITSDKKEEDIDTQNITSTKEEEDIDYEDIADKIIKNAEKKDRAEVLNLYLYNLLPYSITSTIMQAGNIAKKIDEGKLGVPNALSAGLGAWDLFNKRKYFTAGEIAKFFGTNFYTMQIPSFKGITIKDMSFPGAVPFGISTIQAREYRDADGFITIYENLIRRKQDEIDLKHTYIKSKFRHEALKYKKADGTKTADLNELLKNKTSIWQIGSIYVWPVDKDIAEKSWIPFEFNPDIAEASRAARYNATQILGRMGDLQSYVGTSSITLTLTTKYFPTIKNTNSIHEYPHSHIDGWMSVFDMSMVQMIELAYRSLVMPHFTSAQEPTAKGYQYMKPPLLKIIIGDKNKVQGKIPDVTLNQPFSNFLTYPSPILKTQHLTSELKNHGLYRHFRTFIAASVEIRKNINELPLLLSDDETPYLMDTHGFEVSLSLVEVTPNYMDAVPSFGDYYEETRKIAYGRG